jgi:hypothetical protein
MGATKPIVATNAAFAVLLVVFVVLGACSQDKEKPAASGADTAIVTDTAGSTDVLAQTDAVDTDSAASDADQPTDTSTTDVAQPADVTQGASDASDSVGPPCTDADADGFGSDCSAGTDCDDTNPNFTTTCPDCSSGSLPGCPCKTGDVLPCYSGTPGTSGVGLCVSGQQTCNAGFWTTCKGAVQPAKEVCDNKDNDCDGLTDEGVLSSCGNCDATCSQQTVGQGSSGWNINSESSAGLGLDSKGNLVLDMTQVSFNLKYIWIANSPENTVSKLDCKTGQELGRYAVCLDPSRTSVDLDGNVWVGCRGDGSVAKIAAEKSACIDKNGNGVIDTSTGSTPLNFGLDECVRFVVNPGETSYARAAGVDKDNNVWIGYYTTLRLRKLASADGKLLDTIDLPASPYGLTIDQKGIIWVQGDFQNLIRVDPATKQINTFLFPASAYGINVDKFGRVWVASGDTATVFDPVTSQFTVVQGIASGGRGVAASVDGYIFTAADGFGGVSMINGNVWPPVVEANIPGGGASPVGVALDFEGYVWAINQSTNNASKIDPKTQQVVGVYPVGASPYTYSDMTGYTLNFFTAPKGRYDALFFGKGGSTPLATVPAQHTWQWLDAQVELPEGTSLRIRLRAAGTATELKGQAWSANLEFPPAVFPYDLKPHGLKGQLLGAEVQLVTKDKKLSPVLKSLTAKSQISK